jgi:protocatechuate 4,5-dioxygenase alpha chain
MPDSEAKEYDDIPGTFVFDSAHSRKGYALNMFCMSLNNASNRDSFRADPSAYLDKFKLTQEQRKWVCCTVR